MIDRFTAPDYALAIVAICGGLVVAALVLEYSVPDMDPCPLCMMQRLWFLITGLVAYAGLVHNPRWGIYPLLVIVAALAGAGFAIRQLWLQSLPAELVPACGPDLQYMIEALPLSEVLSSMVSGTGDCASEPPFLGIPLPVWTLAGFAAVIATAVLQWRARRTPEGLAAPG